MSQEQIRVTFEPNGRAVSVLAGTKVLEAAGRAGLAVETPCGGAGTCGKCRVQMSAGAGEPTETERRHLAEAELADGWRLACQAELRQPAIVRIPESSLLAGGHQILTDAHADGEAEILPAFRKAYVELPLPSLESAEADLMRLEHAVGPLKADLDLLRQLPTLLRQGGFRGTAVMADHHLIDMEAGDTTGHCYGAAFDIGTTTVVGSLLDLRDGRELALASRMNPQVSFGDDVLSRIKYASEEAGGLRELQDVIVHAVCEMIDEMVAQAHVRREHIYELAFSGNTTMQHLLCGLVVEQLGCVPFVPAHARGLVLSAHELGMPIHRRGGAYVFPVIGGFVGGDTVSGMLAARLARQEGPLLLVDIGTNGEIVLCHAGTISAASTAAGPAFEGARISCGMRATTGAIEKIVFDGDVRYSVIGGASPIGLCGSALVDLAAELLDHGILSCQGRLLPPPELPARLPATLRNRVLVDSGGQTQFVVAAHDAGLREGQITVTQRDLRELQLATGAIRAGIRILLKQAGLTGGDLKKVLIAGGFGSFIRRSKAQRIGLLPTDIDHSRIQYVGNASLAGARWALLSTNARTEAERLARTSRHVELSQDLNFQMEFAEAMIFPDPPPDPLGPAA